MTRRRVCPATRQARPASNACDVPYRQILIALALAGIASPPASAQDNLDKVTVRLIEAGGSVYMADCPDGFGGGNVAASIGPDGILLVDDMFAAMVPKLKAALQTKSTLPIRIVINSHFHGDHIQGDTVLAPGATLIGHENLLERISRGRSAPPFPMVTFGDALRIRFNGENIRVQHFAHGHTDSDAIVFFETSKVLHLGDMFFFGMFPAVYREGGGDIRQLIRSLDQIVGEFPADTKVIPGHGDLATMSDLKTYIAMLKETVAAVEGGIRDHKSPEVMQHDPAIARYARLGEGGAQTLEQYVAMLYTLLQAS